ncbi:MAG: IS5 family transposase, partial [Proteobacteria bacterium]|nr:IS5 family transposase [Pseudomonadota bacterium]
AHPTDSRLLNRAREQLVGEAQKAGIALRQSYARVSQRAEHQAGRYAHARQYRRMHRELRRLRTWLGRVIRDVQRKGGEIAGALKHKLEIAQRLYEQRRDSKNKLYALHAPEVECIAKGKVRSPYEFGVKVSVAVTAKEGLVVGMRSMPGAPYDGHTLREQIEQAGILTGHAPKIVLADRGYRGVQPPEGTRLLISHTRRLPKALKKLLKRRQVVEPMIGHMKADGLLGKNWLKGSDGDAMHALLCGAGHNLRMILRHLRVFFLAFVAWFTWALAGDRAPANSSVLAAN